MKSVSGKFVQKVKTHFAINIFV